MSTEKKSSTPARPARGGVGVLLVLIAAVAGLYSGARWHDRIGPVFGLSTHAGGGAPAAEAGGSDEGAQLWTCSMHPQVIQEQPGTCPICHMELTPLVVDASAGGAAPGPPVAHGGGAGEPSGRKVKYWWDPMMHPPYISDRPGKSPMGMELVPVYADEDRGAGDAVVIEPAVVQNMGIRVEAVQEGPVSRSVRLVGYLDEAQPGIYEVNLRVSGWVRRLHADTEGARIEAGDPLFDLYSPELQVGIEELIAARRAGHVLAGEGRETPGSTAAALREAAATKLALLGLPPEQIEALSKLDRAPETVTFVSPVGGVLTDKTIVEGSAVGVGDRVMRIVDYSTLWLDARVFEKDLPFVEIGQRAVASIASRPGEPIEGEVVFIDPRVDETTRAARVRLALPNLSLALKPGMYATVRVESRLADRAVLVPREAVIDTGERQVAFVAEAVGHFEPREVRLGLPSEGGLVQVLEGLAPGEPVVVSGQFLLDTESRLREAIRKYLSQREADATPSPADRSHGRGAGAIAPASAEELELVDALVLAYLEIAGSLGDPQKAPDPVDMSDVVGAAAELRDSAELDALRENAERIAAAADAIASAPIDEQREGFKSVSEGVIRLVESVPPTAAVGEQLFVVHCPMAPGSWLQTTEEVANPYYATAMKRCGEVERTIPTRAGTP